jgi:hypothetical protein
MQKLISIKVDLTRKESVEEHLQDCLADGWRIVN